MVAHTIGTATLKSYSRFFYQCQSSKHADSSLSDQKMIGHVHFYNGEPWEEEGGFIYEIFWPDGTSNVYRKKDIDWINPPSNRSLLWQVMHKESTGV